MNNTTTVLLVALLASYSLIGCRPHQPAIGPPPSQETKPSGAPRYTVTVLGTLGDRWGGRRINTSGQIAGERVAPEPDEIARLTRRAKSLTHAVRWTGDKVEELDTMGGITAEGFAINASGQIAGTSKLEKDVNGWTNFAVRWTGTSGEVLGTLGGDSDARGINASGQVTGVSRIKPGGDQHAVRWTGTKPDDLGTLGGKFSAGMAINDSGQVTGHAALPGGNGFIAHAVRWTGKKCEDLGTLGGANSIGMAINASGQVAGESLLKGSNPYAKHAVLWKETEPTDLGTLGGTASWATDINAAGDIVGMSRITGDADIHPFLYTGRKMYDLTELIMPSSGVTRLWIEGINDLGQIIGSGLIGDKSCAVRLDPVDRTK
jgi:probable HAF family extracellular repeat protein